MTRPPLSVAQIVPATRQKAMLALSFLALSILGMIHPANAQEVTYIIFDAPGSTNTLPSSINAEGAITGSYGDANYVQHGFLRAPDGTITTFDPPGSVNTFSASINRVGAIAGAYTDTNFVAHGFLRSPDGTITSFDPPGAKGAPGGPGTGAAAINGVGTITGSYEVSNAIHGFLRYRGGTFTTFHVPGGALERSQLYADAASDPYVAEAEQLRVSGIFRAGDSLSFAAAVSENYGLEVQQQPRRILLSGLPHPQP